MLLKYLKISSIIALYTFSCIGLVIDFHYCGGNLESVSLFHADEKGCCGDDESKKPGCCEDRFVVIDTDDTESGKKYDFSNANLLQSVSNPPPFITSIVDYQQVMDKMVIPIDHAPPNSSHTPMFIKNRKLVI